MRKIQSYIYLCAGLLMWMSCVKENNINEFIQQANQLVDANPQEAMQLLEGIPDPELLNQDNYMQYIVTYTQARYMSDQGIAKDSTILDVQRHFSNSNNYEMATRASYYSAAYWDEKGVNEKVLEYLLLVEYFAEQAENNLFLAKCANWFGVIYHDLEMWESAKIYCQKALELYDKESLIFSNINMYKLDLINMLGQICLEEQNLEQAAIYYDNGLKSASDQHNTEYEARFLHNKGVVSREQKGYQRAKEYFNLALEFKPDTEDLMRIYLSYAKLYKATNQPDSTIYYLNLVKNRMEEITYPYTRRAIYEELSTYYEKEGIIPEMKHYLKLATIEDKKISNSQNEENILLIIKRVNKRFEKQIKSYHLVIISIIFAAGVASLLVWFIFKKQLIKLKDRYRKLRQSNAILNLDINRILVNGLRGIAKSMDVLKQEKKARSQSLPYTSVGEEFQMLRENFNEQMAELTGDMIKQYPNGALALLKICIEDLCILRLTQLKYSNDSIGWMLGYKANIENYVEARKRRMRETMTESGMRTQDINLLFRPIIPV